jgi:hypothetical protein
MVARAAASDPSAFYTDLLRHVKRLRIPFMLGGTCAVNAYVGLDRATKDLDIFCRAGDYPRLLASCAERGYATEVEDERWIAKLRSGPHYCDVIFGSANMIAPVTDQWFAEARPARVFGVPVRLIPPTELIWSKSFIQDRYKFDGNDVAHLILVQHEQVDWKRMLRYFDQHWEVLLTHLIRFRYIYPSERDRLPGWPLDDLLGRLADQRKLPLPRKLTCRGRIFSRDDFQIDIAEWGLADLVGDDKYSGPGRDDADHSKGLRLPIGRCPPRSTPGKDGARPVRNGRRRKSA